MNRRIQTTPYPDPTPLGTLATSELVVVTTLRLWVSAACGPAEREIGMHWYDGLAAAGVSEEGSMAFHKLMEAILIAANEPLDFRPIHCRLLGRDEGYVLQTFGLLQHHRKNAAAYALSVWMPPAACRLAGARAILLAGELSLAGLTIPLRREDNIAGIKHPTRRSEPEIAQAPTRPH